MNWRTLNIRIYNKQMIRYIIYEIFINVDSILIYIKHKEIFYMFLIN
jgi:hypothetical protein